MALINTVFAIIDWYYYRHVIQQQAVHPEPIIVLGHPRTGTTHVQNLLSLDPNFAFVDTFQAGFASGFLCTQKFKELLSPILSDTRPMDAMTLNFNTPAEDEIAVNALTGGISPYMSLMFMRKHRSFTKFCSFEGATEEELETWCSNFVYFMKKVTYSNGGCKPLVIKSPVHMGRLKIFQRLFPRARYVMIHRDPLEVFQSSAHMADTYFWYCSLQVPTDKDNTDYILEQHNMLYDAYIRDRELIEKSALIEISFADLDTNPIGTLQRVYQRFNLMNFEEMKPVFKTYLQQLEGFKKNDHTFLKPSLRSRIEATWSRVFEEFGYRHSNHQHRA